MIAFRKKPEIGGESPLMTRPEPEASSLGCIVTPLFLVISYFVLSAITRVTSNTGTKLDQAICYGTLISFVIICILGIRQENQKREVKKAEQQKWLKACSAAYVTIANRRDATTWDDGYRYHYASCRLELEMNSDQKRAFPSDTIVSVEVGQSIYEKLEKRDTVRIYYKPESPLTFLLEEEL